MAEMENKTTNKNGPGVKKSKKQSTRVDLTPMVDLGFLLITFFIFSTTMLQPAVLNLSMPKDVLDPEDSMNITLSGALTIMLGKENLIYYYFKKDPASMQETSYKEVRDIILEKRKTTAIDNLFIIIKPGEDATYKNAVDILDEMNINDIPRYAMVNLSERELDLMQQKEKAAGN